jgi:hypothetical protein
MVQEMSNGYGTANWWRLTPDLSGSYQNGAWSRRAIMPNIPDPTNPANMVPYAPLYYASVVLPDGRVVVMGGEYNGPSGQVETAAGAIYDPATDSWTTVASPVPPYVPGQSGGIGDASGIVLADGTFMLGPCCYTSVQWLLNTSTMTWTSTGTNKADGNSEESWTLLPNGNVLTVDTSNGTNSEVYNPGSGSWSSAGNTPVALPGPGLEIGPGVLRPDGSVFSVGGNSNTAVYGAFGGWSPGPGIPNGGNGSDVPAALLTNGRVLVETADHPLNQNIVGTHFYEFDGINLTATANPPGADSVYGFVGRMLVLPTGEILFTNQTGQVALYHSSGTYQAAWQPTINSIVSTSLGIGLTGYTIYGTQFNGLSQGAMYGDDAQSATNYPLVRITNNGTGHVFYAKTHNHSTMAVATGSALVSTQFDVPSNVEQGDSTLQVVVNGIPSNPIAVTVYVPVRRRACCV